MFYATKSLWKGNDFRVPSFFNYHHRGVEIEEVLYCQWLQNIVFWNSFVNLYQSLFITSSNASRYLLVWLYRWIFLYQISIYNQTIWKKILIAIAIRFSNQSHFVRCDFVPDRRNDILLPYLSLVLNYIVVV